MDLVATPGASNANSYATVDEADSYHEGRLHAGDWTSADDATKEAALQEACRLLDAAFTWTGAATSGNQALCWPRTGMISRNGYVLSSSLLPLALKDAQCEFARQLITADRSADNDAEKGGLLGVKAGPVAVTFRDPSIKTEDDLQAQAIGAVARIVPDVVRMLLVKSWYTPPAMTKGPVFEML